MKGKILKLSEIIIIVFLLISFAYDNVYGKGNYQTNTPIQPNFDELTTLLLDDVSVNGGKIENNIKIVNLKINKEYGLIDFYEEGVFEGEIAIIKFISGEWRLFSSINPEFNSILTNLPNDLLSETNKQFFYVGSNFSETKAIYTGHKLPWEGGISRKVTQTPSEHNSAYNDWAYDFSMNVGTPLWASKSGTVALIKENSSLGACNSSYANYANYVVINNDGDDSATLYLHLNTNGVSVNLGQHVNQGDLIGYSGQTGFSCGAHLHFQVQQRGSWWAYSQRVIFDSPIGEPVKDSYVVSNNYRTPPIANCSNPTSTDVYVCDPILTPTYNGNTCTSFWYKFTGYENHSSFLTLNAFNSSTSSNSGIWIPNLPATGLYEIFTYIGRHGNIDRNCGWTADTVSIDSNHAKYKVYNSSTSLIREVEINQYPYANQWVSLGQFNLNKGTSGFVKLTDVTGETRLSHNVSFGALRFKLIQSTCYTLNTSVAPENSGTISLSIYNSGICPHGSYEPDTLVTVSAFNNSDYVFQNWSGASSSSSSNVSITMNSNKTITANFAEIEPTFEVLLPLVIR